MIKALITQSKNGNVKAAALLLGYAYGKPKVQVEIEGGEKPLQIQIVEVAQPKKRADNTD